MLDRKFIIAHVEQVKKNCADRGVDCPIDRFVELDAQCRNLDQQLQELNRRANEVSKSIGKAPDAAERDRRKEEGRRLREEKDGVQGERDKAFDELQAIQRQIPNIAHPDVPVGQDEKANLEIRRGKHAPAEPDFTAQDHVDLGERLGLFDFEAAGRISGHGFYFLQGDAVRLELALQHYVLEKLTADGFTICTTPDLARREILEGIGFHPRGKETQIYSIENSDLCLIATAEITLGGYLAGQTVDAEQLPIKMAGVSHCFRTEAGAHGRATRGLYRVHQFTKVEMFAFTRPDESDAMLDHFCQLECDIFDDLHIPYRVVDTATGDLGAPAYRKFDLEAWMPGRGEWGEVTSTSNCTDYQARRLNIRFKRKGEKGTELVHTLNGTAIATSRTLIAILENYQRADGTVEIPQALQPWMGKDVIG